MNGHWWGVQDEVYEVYEGDSASYSLSGAY